MDSNGSNKFSQEFQRIVIDECEMLQARAIILLTKKIAALMVKGVAVRYRSALIG